MTEPYRTAIELDPEYDLAWFNLGGMYWNAGLRAEAAEVWKGAVQKFPDHALTQRLREELPFALK